MKEKKWINTMPNERTSLASKKDICICASRFDSDLINVRGRKLPSQSPSILPGVPKSCLKQVHRSQRTTQNSTEMRQQKQQQIFIEADKIISHQVMSK